MGNKPLRWHENSTHCLALFSLIISVFTFSFGLWGWNSTGADPKMDHVAASLTILQTLLGMIGVGGFFLVRSAAVSAAEAEARQEFDKFKTHLETLTETVARRAALEYLNETGMRGGNGSSAALTPSLMQALDDEEAGDD